MSVKSEKEKMLAGEPYDAGDSELKLARLRARSLCQRINALTVADVDAKTKLLSDLFGQATLVKINQPFFCDYGLNIRLGQNVYFNYNCVVLDVAAVTIGNNVLFGPSVHIYTATHPMSARERRAGLESGRPVVVEDDVWVGGGTVICPGVVIGTGSVVGAGSVVTKSVPSGVFAAGNPCKVIRNLPTEAERDDA
jgi:maltose O-acetyltransferase